MKKSILSVCLIFMVCLVTGQSFQFESIAPFDIDPNTQDEDALTLVYLFEDADQDGDADLTLMGLSEQDTTSEYLLLNLRYFMEYQENTGTHNSPQFSARHSAYPNFNFPIARGFMLPDGGDLNGDGLIDFVVSAETDIYSVQYLQFQIQNPDGTFTVTNALDWDLDPFLPYSFYVPVLTDLDSDGDLDILLGGYYRDFDEYGYSIDVASTIYAKNIGTPTNPMFQGWYHSPYGLEASTQSFYSTGDFDLDGDEDVLCSSLTDDDRSVLMYYENVGLNKPEFLPPIESPFGLPIAGEDESFLSPSIVDIDGDGDLDIFLTTVVEGELELRFYKNQQLSSSEKLNQSNVYVYPTLTNGIVYFELGSHEKLKSIKIHDAKGQQVMQLKNLGLRVNELDVGNNQSGLYFICFETDNKVWTEKVILIK